MSGTLHVVATVAWSMLLLAEFRCEACDPPEMLRFLSYNVQFLPGPGKFFNKRGQDDYRAVEIGRRTAEFDVVAFNEVFEIGPRAKILDELKAAWGGNFHVYECPEPPADVRKYNAGLAVASRFPIVETHHIPYSRTSTIQQFGVFADEFAQKGALHARVRVPTNTGPLEIDVFCTHLDSKLASVRTTQIDELADFAATHSKAENPAVFLGDFNTRGNPPYQKDPDSDYNALLSRLRKARPTTIDLWAEIGQGEGGTSDQTSPDGGRRIDYIFFSPPDDAPNRLVPKSVAVRPFLDERVVALSDHSAVEAVFTIQP
jgi:endonuclease/exonuclease/phosphatase family metal-dependent hydrolase